MSSSVPKTKDCEDIETAEEYQEHAEEYGRGGFHLVRIGDKFIKRYQAIRKLGWGSFSTVWLCRDIRKKQYVAIKIAKADEDTRETARAEADLLYDIKERAAGQCQRVITIRNDFELRGPNGLHVCIVSEVMGDSLYRVLVRHFKNGLPIEAIKPIVRQILEGLHFLHVKCGLIHTDIKPENILLTIDSADIERMHHQVDQLLALYGEESKLPESFVSTPIKVANQCTEEASKRCNSSETENLLDGDRIGAQNLFDSDFSKVSVKIADLGNVYAIEDIRQSTIQTRPYRSPEVLLGQGFGTSADIWSLGAMTFELATGELLFDWDQKEYQNLTKNEILMIKIIERLGPLPKSCRTGKFYRDYFKLSGRLTVCREISQVSISEVLVNQFKWHKDVAEDFTEFLNPMLRMDRRKRATARKCLKHRWLK